MRRLVVVGARRAPLAWYFAGAFGISLFAFWVIGLPRFHAGSRPSSALVMFPVMVVGVGALGLAITAATSGRPGLRLVRSSLRPPRVRAWLMVVLIPPAAILAVLEGLRVVVSPNYAPQLLLFGVAAGLAAGFFEELGWTGFAYPRMCSRMGWLPAALVLGVVWGLWHVPVVDALGAASPHGTTWPAFLAAFVAMVTALRVLIAWVYEHTGSILVAQALHASSSGSLVIFGAPHVTPAQEAAWYFAYACVLGAVAVVAVRLSRPIGRQPVPAPLLADRSTDPVGVAG
jgi:membrane protease YdiL (CAAX protease family)